MCSGSIISWSAIFMVVPQSVRDVAPHFAPTLRKSVPRLVVGATYAICVIDRKRMSYPTL